MSSRYLLLVSLIGTLVWLVPNHYYPWASFYNEFLAFSALVLLGGALPATVRDCSFPLVVGWGVAALSLYLGVQFGLELSDYSSASLVFVVGCYLTSMLAAYFIGLQAQEEKFPLLAPLAVVFISASIISVGLALLQWLEMSIGMWLMDVRPGGRPYANLAQPNNLATLLLMGLAGAVFVRSRGLLGPRVFWLVALFLLLGIALTQSRTAIIGLCVLTSLIVVGRWRCSSGISVAEGGAMLGGYALFVLILPLIQDALILPGASLVDRGAVSVERIELWGQTLNAIRLAPWVGYGWHQVGPALVEIAPAYDKMLYAEYSHNLFLDLLVWNGIPVGLLLIGLILWWSVTRVARCRDLETCFALSIIGVICVHSMLELPHAYAYFLIPAGLLAGVVDRDHPGAKLTFDSRWMILPVLGGTVLLAAVFSEYRQIEEAHRQMRFAAARIGSPTEADPVPNVRFLGHLADFIYFARSEAREDMSSEELAEMRKVVRNNAYPPALFRYALALGLNHRHEDAAMELRRLRVLHGEDMYAEARVGWMAISERYPQMLLVEWP